MLPEVENRGERIVNNYFDGIPMKKKQFLIMFVLIIGSFFEQIDNQLTSYVGPNVMSSLQIGNTEWALMSTVTLTGMFLGGVFGGAISDALGRKKTFLGSLLVVTLAAFGCGCAGSFSVFLALRLFQGIAIMSMTVCFVVYLLEITPSEQRGKWEGVCAGVSYFAIPAIGALATWLLPIHEDAWRWLFYLAIGGAVPFVFGLFVMPESPRWLISKGRLKEAEDCVYELVQVNVDLSEALKQYQQNVSQKQLKGIAAFKKLVEKRYIKRTIVLIVICIAETCPFALMSQWNNIMLQDMGIVQETSLLITAFGTFGSPLGCLLGAWIGPKGGRRLAIVFSFACQTVFFLLYVFVATNVTQEAMVLAPMYLFSLMFANCTLICVNPYLGESYPTQVRNFGTGFINSIARLTTAGVMGLVPSIIATAGIFGIGILSCGMIVVGMLAALIFGWSTGRIPLEQIND